MFFLFSLLSIHDPAVLLSTPNHIVDLSAVRSKSSKTESQDILTHQRSFVLEIIPFIKERLAELEGMLQILQSSFLLFSTLQMSSLKNLDSFSITKLFNDKIRMKTCVFPAQCYLISYTQSLRQDSYHCPFHLPKESHGAKTKKLKQSMSSECSKEGF